MKRYARIDKDVRYSALWVKEPVGAVQAWLDLTFMADDFAPVRIGSIVKAAECGVVWTSHRYLMKRWDWERGKVVRFLAFLEREELAKVTTDEGITRIEVMHLVTSTRSTADPVVDPGPIHQQIQDRSSGDPPTDPPTDPKGSIPKPKPKQETKTKTEGATRQSRAPRGSRSVPPEDAHWFGSKRIVWLTPKALQSLIDTHGRDVAQKAVKYLVDYCEALDSRRYDDYAAAIRSWVIRKVTVEDAGTGNPIHHPIQGVNRNGAKNAPTGAVNGAFKDGIADNPVLAEIYAAKKNGVNGHHETDEEQRALLAARAHFERADA